jgi:hypothetical protein
MREFSIREIMIIHELPKKTILIKVTKKDIIIDLSKKIIGNCLLPLVVLVIIASVAILIKKKIDKDKKKKNLKDLRKKLDPKQIPRLPPKTN